MAVQKVLVNFWIKPNCGLCVLTSHSGISVFMVGRVFVPQTDNFHLKAEKIVEKSINQLERKSLLRFP